MIIISGFLAIQCPSKFSTAKQLYCNGACGDDWLDTSINCQKTDADAYCKLKFCDKEAYAISFNISKALYEPGFACNHRGKNFGKYFGIYNVWFEDDVGSTHGLRVDTQVVSNVKCHLTGNSDKNFVFVYTTF